MLLGFIITFREVLEIALILGAIVGYLEKTTQTQFKKIVYGGVGVGLVASFFGALAFQSVKDIYHGTARLVFVGATLIFGALFVVGMLWWQWRQQQKRSLTERMAEWIERKEKAGLFLFVALSVFRDGVEVVVFLSATSFVVTAWELVGALVGLVAATACGVLILTGIRQLPVKNIFRFTTTLLILLAASLLIQGVHELGEAGVLGSWVG